MFRRTVLFMFVAVLAISLLGCGHFGEHFDGPAAPDFNNEKDGMDKSIGKSWFQRLI